MNINTQTQLFGIIGNPVGHSLSPAIHNAAFKALGINSVYLAFQVNNLEGAIAGVRSLGIRGASVTVPHKVEVMRHLDALSDESKRIGAVNTVINANGILTGHNTDCEGSMRALGEKILLAGKRVVLLGAGGAARAIAFGLKAKGARVLILNRTRQKAKHLAHDIGAEFGDLSRINLIQNSDVLVNAATLCVIPKHVLHKNLTVFDIVYGNQETTLIRDAKLAGCTVIEGQSMLLHQAIIQFELFTGIKAPASVMEQAMKGVN